MAALGKHKHEIPSGAKPGDMVRCKGCGKKMRYWPGSKMAEAEHEMTEATWTPRSTQPKGRDGRPVQGGEEFNKKHPRAAKGRTGGGQFVQKGQSGNAVTGVQTRLGINADGNYGQATAARVERYQRNHGLKVDGIVGAQTAAALLGNAAHKPGALQAGDRQALAALRKKK